VRISHLIFDLDNTLYPPTRGVVERVDVLIDRFMIERLGMTHATARAVRAHYRNEHGTTLNGLMIHHQVAPDDYLAYVHAIEIEDLLDPDPALHTMLDHLPQPKVIFTNASQEHAERVLNRLGVRGCFRDIFSLERVAYVPKPFPGAFASLLTAIGAPPPCCLVVDDRTDNLRTARALGMRTALVGAAAPSAGVEADFAVPSVLDLERALPAAQVA
jgi:putative hydrolase of the HAD superfamily